MLPCYHQIALRLPESETPLVCWDISQYVGPGALTRFLQSFQQCWIFLN
jgi:hypothetical protein